MLRNGLNLCRFGVSNDLCQKRAREQERDQKHERRERESEKETDEEKYFVSL